MRLWCTCVAVILLSYNHHSRLAVRCAEPTEGYCQKGTSSNGIDCNQDDDLLLTSRTGKFSDPLLPALTPSLFSNVPPTINFIMPGQEKETMPENIRRRLVWHDGGSPLITATANRSGYALTTDIHAWVGCYTGCFQPFETNKYLELEPYQKYNHLPENWAIGCKDRLAVNILKQKLTYGKKNFNFFPTTYVLPRDLNTLKAEWNKDPNNQLWILKPPCFHGGRGIQVFNRFEDIPKDQANVVQRYISNPLLIDGYKFDLRLYVFVPRVDPLRIYLFPDGIVKFATKKFRTDDLDEMIHLTNNEVNTKNPSYTLDNALKTGHKWSLSTLWGYLKANRGVDTESIWENIKDIVIKTIVTGESAMYEGVRTYLKSKYSGHELFGFDVLLDENLKPWVLEVNVAPGILSHPGYFHPVNDPMAKDMLNIAGYRIPELPVTKGESELDVPADLLLDKRWWTKTLSSKESEKQKYYVDNHKNQEIMSTILDNLTPDDVRILVDTIDENSRRGDFERIFPRIDTDIYFKFFEKIRYHNLLVHQWLKKFHQNEAEGIAMVESYCKQSKHLSNET